MNIIQDEETGDAVVLNDLTNLEFDVYAEIGQSYATQKEQTAERLESLISTMPPGDPMREILMMKLIQIMPGVSFDDVRDYARMKLIAMGVVEPETEEEKQKFQEMQQQQNQPDANMVLAQAEMEKANASKMETQRKAAVDQFNAQTDQGKAQISAFEAQTKRMSVQVDAQEVGAEIDFKRSRTLGQKIDNMEKLASPLRASVN
jgi:hypothetical protein